MRHRKIIVVSLCVVLLVGTASAYAFLFLNRKTVALVTGDTARIVCAAIFVAHRNEAVVRQQELYAKGGARIARRYLNVNIGWSDKSVTTDFLGIGRRKAIFRRGIGCRVDEGVTERDLWAQGEGVDSAVPPPDPAVQWPEGDATIAESLPASMDTARLKSAVDKAFLEPNPEKPRGTRGVVVVYGGRIVAERYADGFDKNTPQLSYSMAKSLTNALVGVLVRQGKLSLQEPAPITEWRGSDDARGAITIDQLLHMTSGLTFSEDYVSVNGDVAQQYIGGDLAGYSAAKPLRWPPGTYWHYSTGAANIIGRIVRQAAGPDFATAFAFPTRELFDPIGMRGAVLEVDSKGNFIAGTLAYASPRDYARLGLLYLRDGVWNGRRILPEGWVSYTRTPVVPENTSDNGYGALFWLNFDDPKHPDEVRKVPPDTFEMEGYAGQGVFIVPSRDAVIVRLGESAFNNWSGSDFARDVLSALPPAPEQNLNAVGKADAKDK